MPDPPPVINIFEFFLKKQLQFYFSEIRLRASFLMTEEDMSQSREPEVISLTQQEVEALKKRIIESPLTASDQKIMLSVLSLNFWLQQKLANAQLSIVRLKKIFGFSTEKKTLSHQEMTK